MAEPEFTDAIALLKSDHRKVEDLFEPQADAQLERRLMSFAGADEKSKHLHDSSTRYVLA